MDLIKAVKGSNDSSKDIKNINQINTLTVVEEKTPIIKLEVSDEDLEIIENFSFPAYNEIPDVGLFLEQTGKYINEFLKPLLKQELTGSMISNYVKKKIIESPVKKQYYRNHIVELIFIAMAKPILSLESVRKIIEVEKSITNIRETYETFCAIFEETLKKTFHLHDDKHIKQEKDNATTAMRYIAAAVSYKIFLDRCLE